MGDTFSIYVEVAGQGAWTNTVYQHQVKIYGTNVIYLYR